MGIKKMITVQCGKTVTLDITEVHPGMGELWIIGDPVIDWGDGNSDNGVSGANISHTYTSIGTYDILLGGENGCTGTCTHEETVVTLENPGSLTATNVTKNDARITWDAVLGTDAYGIELYKGSQYINEWSIGDTHIDITNLDPETTYMVYVSAIVSLYQSEQYCGENRVQFTTLADVCNPPTCEFAVSV